jgi:hypothetical protein
MTDIQAAAERYAKHKAGGIERIGESPYWLQDWFALSGGTLDTGKLNADRAVLANAYLSLAPRLAEMEREREPITLQWLEDIGLMARSAIDLFSPVGGTNQWGVSFRGWVLPPIQTRGELRALCKFLGISLKEAT